MFQHMCGLQNCLLPSFFQSIGFHVGTVLRYLQDEVFRFYFTELKVTMLLFQAKAIIQTHIKLLIYTFSASTGYCEVNVDCTI